MDEAQLWDPEPRSCNILRQSVIRCVIARSPQPPFINPSCFHRLFLSPGGLNGWRAWRKKGSERGHAECQTICLAIPDSDHVHPGNTDARLSGETQTSNEDKSKKEQDHKFLIPINQISNWRGSVISSALIGPIVQHLRNFFLFFSSSTGRYLSVTSRSSRDLSHCWVTLNAAADVEHQ